MIGHTNKPNLTSKLWRRVLLLTAAFITAIAVAVTCIVYFDSETPMSVDDVSDVTESVETSAANSQNWVGKILNGDVKTYSYGTSYEVTLPRGTYKLEAWGARGGQYSSVKPGYGGYTYGTYTFTETSKTIYIYVGSVGTNGNSTNRTKAGGYNGGGAGVRYGSGGGGATHFATRDGLLSSLNSYRSNVLIVAGGGGGSQARQGGNGGGGSRNGVKCPSSSYGTGGCGGGTSKAHGDPLSSHSSGSQSGSFGQGGPGLKGGDGNGGGGGGGGYFGGCGVTSDGSVVDDKGGGGGSGYINTTYISGGNGTSGAQNGQGSARITAINVNTPPTSSNRTLSTSYYRGAQTISIAASHLAQDPDPANAGSNDPNRVYFSAGNSSNYDTPPGQNQGLYLDAACTQVASSYLSWTFTSTTLTINNILRYPRASVNSQVTNGQFRLYTKIRDNYGSSGSQRGVTVVPFYINILDHGITANTSGVRSCRSDLYRVGTSTSNSTETDYITNKDQLFHPSGSGKKTVFLPKPISPSDKNSYTIYASDIFTDADSQDKVAFKSLSIPSDVSKYFTVTYNSDNSNYESGLYPSISIKATGVRPPNATYVTLRITAQSSETLAKLGMVGNGATNAEVDLVFKISNTRPYFASSTLNTANQQEPIVRIAPGQSGYVDLNSMVYDIDDGANITSSFVPGEVKIPTNEYIQVDLTNTLVPLKENVGSNYYGRTSINTTDGSLSSKTGEGTDPTGFNQGLVAAAGSTGAATANVVYSYDNNNKRIVFTARNATQNQYKDNDTTRLGHFYVLVRVTDPSDSTDLGIWYPIAIEVTSQAPTSLTPLGNVTLDFEYEKGTSSNDVTLDTPVVQYLTPISYIDNTTGEVCGVGYYQATERSAVPIAIDPDTFKYSTGALNDLVVIDGGASAILDNDNNTTGTFFRVEPITLTAPAEIFRRIPAGNLTGLGISLNADGLTASFPGLVITPIRATDDEYFRFRVNVKDTHGTTGTATVAVKVNNRELSPRRDPAATTSYPINAINGRRPDTPWGEYGHNPNIGQMAVNYTIENMDEIQITPYDLVYDLDTDWSNERLNPKVNGVVNYNTNPLDSGFTDAARFIIADYDIAHSSSTSDSPKVTPTKAQLLSFVNPTGIETSAAQYAGYIGTEVTSVKVGSTTYSDIPCIKITGRSRTTSAIVQLRFEITDGFSSVECLVTITVLNSAPLLNTVDNHPLGAGETLENRITEPYYMSATVSTKGLNNAYSFTAREIAYDKDGDNPTFVAGTAKAVALVNGEYYQYLDANFNGLTEEQKADAVYTLSDYVYATITKDGGGNDVVYFSALSSTEFFPVPVYLEFTVQDGFRAQPGIATLHLLIEVKNSDPIMNSDGLTLRKEDVDHPENNEYAWMINYENRSELNQTRYIANSEEMYNAINAPSANKIWLFNDADAQQRTLFNPADESWVADGAAVDAKDLVATFDNKDKTSGAAAGARVPIPENEFASKPKAAIIYTPMYHAETDKNISITVKFYEKIIEDGVVKFNPIAQNDAKIKTAKYWVIELSDKHTDGSYEPIQIAIAVKDDHHGKTLYDSADKKEQSETPDDSKLTVFNFYYGYNKPGVTSMHTYFRTDGNAEAQTKVDDKYYLVDIASIDPNRDFKTATAKAEYAALTTDAARQEYLKTVEFSDNFKYQYYVKSYGKDATPTYKVFQNSESPFCYKPIDVAYSSTNVKVNVPMSYIAMPQAHGTNTETGGDHVAFANATAAASVNPGAGEKLLDSQYSIWSGAQLQYVYENLTLSDGSTSWTGSKLNDNPYINIDYIVAGESIKFDTRYVNNNRFTLSNPGDRAPMTDTDFREDKYGFAFSKKSEGDSVRAPGLLKLTVAVKTLGLTPSVTPTNVEYVDVDINLVNTRPEIKYVNENAYGQLTTVTVNMTMADMKATVDENGKDKPAGVTIDFKRDDTNGDHRLDTTTIFYSDRDRAQANSNYNGDTMKFYMPSAFGTMSDAEVDYVCNYGTSCSDPNMSDSALLDYYGVTNRSDIVDVDTPGKVNKYNYNPNPNFEKFFSVSPVSGAASSLQFIPKAKTQPQISEDKLDEYLGKYNLRKDENNNVYYPFKVLFYDDCDNSSFVRGYWTLATIKVYITNNKIRYDSSTVKEKYESTSTQDSSYNQAPMYKFDLSAGAAFFVDVTSLLIDNDIELDKTNNTLVTSSDAYTGDDKYIKDYLVMPAANDHVNINRLVNTSAPMPVTVKRGGDDAEVSTMPQTTLVFKTERAFKGRVNLAYTFRDSSGESDSFVTIVFSVGYNNAVPKTNDVAFGGSDSIDIYMKRGDYFVMYASDSTKFADDVAGDFDSAKPGMNTLGGVNFPFDELGNSGAVAKDAETMYLNNFRNYVGSYPATPNEGGNMGSIVLGSDDAASTLRIQSKYISSEHSRYVSVTEFGNAYASENDPSISLPVALLVRANGAIDTTVVVTLVDGSGATVVVNVRIHVLSTPPAVKDNITSIPAVGNSSITLNKSQDELNTFSLRMSYGQKAKFAIGSFMGDVDIDDEAKLLVYTGMDGNDFLITNPGSTATVTARSFTENSINYIEFSATDYINENGKTANVRFRIVDRNGSVSDYVNINVTIAPVSVVAVPNPRTIELMSYADFANVDGNASVPISVDLVSGANAAILSDADVTAPSAMYDVVVYALIKKQGDSFVAAREEEITSEMRICSVESETPGTGSSTSEIYKYVSRFFTASVSTDGKRLEFIPNSATFNEAATAISSIPLYISVGKRYITASDSTVTMPLVNTSVKVSVANSKIVAVENSPFNSGYPQVGDKLRESDFLEFTGTAGDSLTWKLYNTDDYELGLFYDWDMRRASGGKEKIEYVGHKVVMPTNEGITGKGDVLSVSHTGLGAEQTITIKINRKVYPGNQPSTPIEVWIYTADSVNNASKPTINDTAKVCATKIIVNVENDTPEIATTGLVLVCPYCRDSEHVRQVAGSKNTARCGNCNRTFKSLDPDLLGYSVTLSDVDGYVLDAKLENGKTLDVSIPDIINDADIDMDGYSLVSLGSDDSLISSNGTIKDAIMSSDNKRLFDIKVTDGVNSYGVSTISRISFTCRSNMRGLVGTVRVQFKDSVANSTTHVLTINLTVDNIAPSAKPGTTTNITMMGAGANAADADLEQKAKTFSILDFVTDANGDAFDATLAENANLYTYVFIDEIIVYMTDDLDNAPTLYGYGVYERDPETGEIVVDQETGNKVYAHDTLCRVEWVGDKHQSFKITPFKQVYGTQKVTIVVSDSGYEDGMEHDVIDGKSTAFTFTITIANPLEDVGEVLDSKNMVFGVTRAITAKDLLGEENAMGYTISSIEEVEGRGYLSIYEPGSGDSNDWRIHALTEGVEVNVKVTFTAGGITVTRTLPIKVVVNNAPVYKNDKKSYVYTTKMLVGNSKNQLHIYPEDWFEDRDAEDVMEFIAPVSSSQSVKVEVTRALDDNGRAYLLLTFNRRGEADITVNITDLSGRTYTRTVTVNCTDAPEMSWWEEFVSMIEANLMWFWIIVAASVVFIVLLIVIIVVVCKKRKMRREIEALLESETELEEEMMRLSAGPAGYQSFGYLPPTQAAPDPGLMLGGGAGAPNTGSLQLNAGTGAPTTGVDAGQLPPPAANPQGGTFNTIPGSAPQGQRPPQQPQQGMQQRPNQQQFGTPQGQRPPQQPGQQGRPMTPPPPQNNDGFNPDDF